MMTLDTLLAVVTLLALATAAGLSLLVSRLASEQRRRSEARIEALRAAAAGDEAAHPPAGSRDLFVVPERSSRAARLGVLAVAGLGLGLAGYAVARAGGDGPVEQVQPAQPALELLSLRHTQEPDGITITGLVQNAATGAPVTRVTATAFAFAADGTFLASGRAPLDYGTLDPGDESPFVIKVPIGTGVARYRVGFRDADGRVVAHVDRRDQVQAAVRN